MSKNGDDQVEPVKRLKEMIRANEEQLKTTREILANLNATTKPASQKISGKDGQGMQADSSS